MGVDSRGPLLRLAVLVLVAVSHRYVALLRAVNVGGRFVKMEQLRQIFTSLKLANVSTFITSGNVLFESNQKPDVLEALIEKRLQKELGYEVATFIRTIEEMKRVAAHEPFRRRSGDSLHVVFLKKKPGHDAGQALLAAATDADSFALHDREAYWLIRGGFGDSKFSGAKLEKLLGPGTARNVTTVTRIAAR